MKGLHHLHIRKRLSRGLEPFPARSSWKRFLDRVVFVVGVIGPMTTIPQITKIYLLQNATGVSAFTWLAGAIFDIPWILYGAAHRERPIMITYTLWFLANTTVFVGAIMYGADGF
jgi:uncharacterized protein with PQ loop repeat